MALQFDQRETLLIADAIALAIEVMDRLPEEHRPQRDISDLIRLQNSRQSPVSDRRWKRCSPLCRISRTYCQIDEIGTRTRV
jgi:hypothetical protein